MLTILIVGICISAFVAFVAYCACVLASRADDARDARNNVEFTWEVGEEEGSR